MSSNDDGALGREPTQIPPAHLGDVFSAPSRTAGLAGRLTRPTAPDPDPTPTPAPAVAPRPIRSPKARSTKPAPEVAPTPKATTERARPVVAYLPLSLKNRLKATRDRDGLSYTLVVLTAVDAVKDRLVDRWQTSRPQGSSFVGWKRARQQHAEPLVPITLRLVAEDEDTLDGIWRAAEAPNRSAYIAAALEEYLVP